MRRLLLIGCGDIARRLMPLLVGRYHLFALLRHREEAAHWRAMGATPLIGDLDQPATLRRLAGVAEIVIHLAPPPNMGEVDQRTRHLLAALAQPGQRPPQQIVYISTSGVYGDCQGALVSETRRPNPQTARARRRLDAETVLRDFARRERTCVSILRVPGIYASDRLPLERLQRQLPALHPDEDVYTNHIHADDLARVIIATLRFGRPSRRYNVADNSALKMGEYFDAVADHFHLPRPPRLTRSEIESRLTPLQVSFLRESRRLDNTRLKHELHWQAHYPDVLAGLATMILDPGGVQDSR